MSNDTDIKHLRTRTYELISDVCVAGTPDLYQEAQAFSDKLYTLILASGPESLAFLLESLERDLGRGEFSGGDEEVGFDPATASQSAKELLGFLRVG